MKALGWAGAKALAIAVKLEREARGEPGEISQTEVTGIRQGETTNVDLTINAHREHVREILEILGQAGALTADALCGPDDAAQVDEVLPPSSVAETTRVPPPELP